MSSLSLLLRFFGVSPRRTNRKRKLHSVWALGLALSLVFPAGGWAQMMPEAQACMPVYVPTPMKLPGERTKKSLNQIYEFDHLPLGNRIPVILVPGRAEEFQHDSWWKRFNEVTGKNETFQKNYKLYVFLYDSKDELDLQARSLAVDLKKHFGGLPKEQPLMLVAYSLGGVMAREILKDRDLLDRVDTLFAIAVPFHGSPIFDPAWFSEFLNPTTRFPIRRFVDRTLYRLYMFDKSNLSRGMGWDNFDGSKPQFHVDHTPHIIGDQINGAIPLFEEYPNADEIRAKTIIYASYLENPYTRPQKISKTSRFMMSIGPDSFLGKLLPLYGFTVHSVFRYTNYQLANLITYTIEDPEGRNTNLYRYNDGAIPMSSMLFLKPSVEPYAGDIEDLIQKATVQKLRIFLDIDHVDMGEYNWQKKKLIRSDIAHPDETPRSPNQWIIDDLNQRYEQLQRQRSDNRLYFSSAPSEKTTKAR
jgi:hypothetical protein